MNYILQIIIILRLCHTGQNLRNISGNFLQLCAGVIIARQYIILETYPINYACFWPLCHRFLISSNIVIHTMTIKQFAYQGREFGETFHMDNENHDNYITPAFLLPAKTGKDTQETRLEKGSQGQQKTGNRRISATHCSCCNVCLENSEDEEEVQFILNK